MVVESELVCTDFIHWANDIDILPLKIQNRLLFKCENGCLMSKRSDGHSSSIDLPCNSHNRSGNEPTLISSLGFVIVSFVVAQFIVAAHPKLSKCTKTNILHLIWIKLKYSTYFSTQCDHQKSAQGAS